MWGGPGSGKSTLAAAVFSDLKWAGIDTELVTEYAKSRVWENALDTLDNQIYVFGKQHHATHKLMGKVQVIVTDAPFLAGVMYDKQNRVELKNLMVSEYVKLNSLNIFLDRDSATFQENGRIQTLSESKDIDERIKSLLTQSMIPFYLMESSRRSVRDILHIINSRLTENTLFVGRIN